MSFVSTSAKSSEHQESHGTEKPTGICVWPSLAGVVPIQKAGADPAYFWFRSTPRSTCSYLLFPCRKMDFNLSKGNVDFFIFFFSWPWNTEKSTIVKEGQTKPISDKLTSIRVSKEYTHTQILPKKRNNLKNPTNSVHEMKFLHDIGWGARKSLIGILTKFKRMWHLWN